MRLQVEPLVRRERAERDDDGAYFALTEEVDVLLVVARQARPEATLDLGPLLGVCGSGYRLTLRNAAIRLSTDMSLRSLLVLWLAAAPLCVQGRCVTVPERSFATRMCR